MEYLQYWKYAAIGAVVLIWVGKYAWGKLPSFKSVKKEATVDFEASEVQDQKAMAHLRNRAIAFGNEDLIKDLKTVHSKFYDIHCQAVKGTK